MRTTFGNSDVEKARAVVAPSTFRSKHVKNTTCSDHFCTFRCRFAWQAQGIVHLVKSEEKREGFAAFPRTMAGVGHLKRIWKDAFRVAGAVEETCSSEMSGGQGADFLRGCIVEHQIFSFGKMILLDRCSTSYDLASLCRGRRSTLDRWSGKPQNALVRGRQLCTQLPYSRKSRRIASFLMLTQSKNEEISQTCFVFDVVKFIN